MNVACQLNKVTQDLICICKQTTFSLVSSIDSRQTDKALPVKTSKPNFVTFFVYFGNSLFDYLWNVFDCYGSRRGSHFLVTPPPPPTPLTRVWLLSLILTMLLLNILCSGLFFGNSSSSISYSYSYSCMPNIKQNIDCHYKSTLQSRMNMNEYKPHYQTTAVYSLGYLFISVRNNDCWSFISLFNNDVLITSHNRFLFLLYLNFCGIAP